MELDIHRISAQEALVAVHSHSTFGQQGLDSVEGGPDQQDIVPEAEAEAGEELYHTKRVADRYHWQDA